VERYFSAQPIYQPSLRLKEVIATINKRNHLIHHLIPWFLEIFDIIVFLNLLSAHSLDEGQEVPLRKHQIEEHLLLPFALVQSQPPKWLGSHSFVASDLDFEFGIHLLGLDLDLALELDILGFVYYLEIYLALGLDLEYERMCASEDGTYPYSGRRDRESRSLPGDLRSPE